MGVEREKGDERERERVSAQVAARKRPRGHGAQASSSCPAPLHPSSSLPLSRMSRRPWQIEGTFRCRDYVSELFSLRNRSDTGLWMSVKKCQKITSCQSMFYKGRRVERYPKEREGKQELKNLHML